MVLLGHKVSSWDEVRKQLRHKDFIPSILSFNTEKISEKARQIVSAHVRFAAVWWLCLLAVNDVPDWGSATLEVLC